MSREMQPPTESRLQSVLKMRERTVLRVLGLGFLMVMLLLGVAGLIAARDSSAIRRDAGQLASEQLLMARLLHEVMAEQNALTQVLHRVADPSAAPPDRVAILAELEAADAAVHSLTQEAMAEGRDWGELHDEVERFTTQVRQFLDRKKQPPDLEETRSLFLRHTAVVQRVDGLLEESSERLSGANGLLESESRKLERESSLLLGACLLLALACAVGTIIFAARSIRHIEWQAEELNRVSWQMLQSQEVAARRFSHELHDELGQSLAAARASLSKLGVADLEPSRADCLHLIDGAISNVRELSQLLRPVILDDFGLEAGLGFLTDKFAQRTRLAVDFEADAPGRFHEETETHLFRITQEALTNMARHSGATAARIALRQEGKTLRLEIEDNGRGLRSTSQGSVGLGMTGMRARARQSGGEMRVEAVQPHGLRIVVEVPARATGEDGAENPYWHD